MVPRDFLEDVGNPEKRYTTHTNKLHSHLASLYEGKDKPGTVDREIFAIKKFSPVAWAAKIKRVKIKYTYTRFIAEPPGGEN